jgi:hypothetical protein
VSVCYTKPPKRRFCALWGDAIISVSSTAMNILHTIFDKSFFKFFLGFIFILAVSFSLFFLVGVYGDIGQDANVLSSASF